MNLASSLGSADPGTVLDAAHAIRHEWDRDLLVSLTSIADDLKRRLSKMNFGGALRPNRSYVDTALERIHLASTNKCLCHSYLRDEMYDPVHEESEGRIRILNRHANHEKQAYEFTCECVLCGSNFAVEERQYHYSWWKWSKAAEAPRPPH